MRIALTLTLLGVSGAVMAETPYDGVYRPDQDWASEWDCSSIGEDGGALAIQDDAFFGLESQCELTNPTQVRDMSATLYDLVCSGEGEEWSERVMFLPVGDRLAVIKDGDISMLRRCE